MEAELKAALDSMIEVADEVAPQWGEEILGMIDEDLMTEAKKDMAADGITDEEEQGSILHTVAVKACYLAYQQMLDGIEEPEVRAYLKSKVEGTAPQAPVASAKPAPGPKLVAPKLS